MVNKLRKRVILYTVASVVLVLALLMGIINAVNYMDKDRNADEILYYLAENGGDFPRHMDHGPKGDDQFRPPRDMTEETPFETRFFSLTLKEDGTVKEINTGKIAAVSSAEAAEMANRAASKGKTTGYDGNYKYLIYDNNGETLYIFLDREVVKRILITAVVLHCCKESKCLLVLLTCNDVNKILISSLVRHILSDEA